MGDVTTGRISQEAGDDGRCKEQVPLKYVRLCLKFAISIPIVVAWSLWISEYIDIPHTLIQIPVFVTICGYVTVLVWFTVTAFFHLALVLKIWNYFSLAVPPFCLAGLVASFYSGDSTAGYLITVTCLLSLLDGLLALLVFPPIEVSRGQLEDGTVTVTDTAADTSYTEPADGLYFFYIPLEGRGPVVPLAKFTDTNHLVLDITPTSGKNAS